MSGRFDIGPENGTVWITGASSGIGKAVARRMAGNGWRVIATARSEDALKDLSGELGERFAAYPGDVTDAARMEDIVQQAEEAHGPIGLAILNAGVYLPVKAPCPDAEAFHKSCAVNLGGVANAMAAVNPRLCRRGKGKIAIVSSATGFGGLPTSAAYGATKAALINMAECLQIELRPWGVGVQVITPGFVDTPAQDDNDFPKPFMISAEAAAERIVTGLRRDVFEITFPRRFTWSLKALSALPARWRLPLVRKQTGWSKPPKGDPCAGRN